MKFETQLISQISKELKLDNKRVAAAVDLLSDGNTIPFIARYRKELTGELNEIDLRKIEDALDRAKALQQRKKTILKSLAEQGVLTKSLQATVEQCTELRTLESVYLPYKPKRRTRATVARDQGLQPLADILLKQHPLGRPKKQVLADFVDPTNDVPNGSAALAGALDIVAETWAEEPETRRWMLDQAMKFGRITSKIKRGKKTAEGADRFDQYFDRQESVSRIPGHRVLAMLRGVSDGFLRVSIELDASREQSELRRRLVQNREFEFFHDLRNCADDCFERLLMPATESAVLSRLKETADDDAIEVFGKNLHDLLMASPAGPKVTIGIDPGFRTGCKVAVVDATGQFLAHTTIYPTPPENQTSQAASSLLNLIQTHQANLIAIGNGTASRETDAFVGKLMKDHDLTNVTRVMVSEAGASIYSASELAAEEFPDLDVTVRGAISIARRLQDPLAELVKSDPKSIGVGQYQHDVNQSKLKKCLGRVVESCVNQVGVDVNLASASLLSYVAGIGPKLAQNIVEHRNHHGGFVDREQLTSVKKLGQKAYEQSAGFLRIRDGAQPLDNSAVHPESYPLVRQMAKRLKTNVANLVGNPILSQKLNAEEFVDARFGLPTIQDIVEELGKPGRDPREEFRVAKFDDAINSIEDLRENLVLEGVITNVTHFGAFIDIGVHQDALIHISQLANQFVSDPNDIIAVGDVVKVKILEVDITRSRIAATRKF